MSNFNIIAQPGTVSASGKANGRPERRKTSPLFRLKRSSSEEEILVAGTELLHLAVRARDPIAASWPEYYDWARGEHWDARRPRWRSRVTTNYLFSLVFNHAAVLTDSHPELRALPREQSDYQVVKQSINPLLEFLWESQGMDLKFMESMCCALIYGTCFLKPFWNPTLMDGQGDIDTDIVEPAYLYPDPGMTNTQNGEFIFDVRPVALDQIRRLWPEKGGRVEPEDISPDWFSARNRSNALNSLTMPPERKTTWKGIPLLRGIFGGRTAKQSEIPWVDIDRALVIELWVKDDASREITDERGKRIERLYPRGRHIVWANGVLLADEENPFDHGMFPYIRIRDYLWPMEFWGGGEIEQLRDLQREMNLHRSRLADHMNFFGNGQWIVDREAMPDTKQLTNQPNAVIRKRQGTEVRREGPLPLPESAIKYLQHLQYDFENIGANNDVNQGRVPDRISSGKAIELVQESAQNRMRLTERLAKESLEDLGDMWLALARQFYDTSRVVRITGRDGSPPQFRRIRPSHLRARYDYEAAVGSQTLRGRQRLTVPDAIALHARGIIDDQAVLEVIDFPEARAVMARLKAQGGMNRQEILNRQGTPGANRLTVVPGGG